MSVGQSGILRAHTLFREGNYGEAVALFSAGAREGNTRALFNLAYCLQYGYGVQADPPGHSVSISISCTRRTAMRHTMPPPCCSPGAACLATRVPVTN